MSEVRQHVLDEMVIPYMESPAKSTMEVYDEISLDWKTQIYNHVVRQYGGKQSSYLQGINKDTLLPQIAVEEFANVVIKENDNDPRLAADVLKAAMTEHVTMMSAMAMNRAMQEKGLMGQITKVTDKMIEQATAKENAMEELTTLIENSGTEADASKKKLTVGDYDGDVVIRQKRKKSKAKTRHHLSMKNPNVRRSMGANILRKLGAIQQQTLDSNKKKLLKELPMADLVEVATGKKLPDYQANLINGFQAKADPEAPVVKRMNEPEGLTTAQMQVADLG